MSDTSARRRLAATPLLVGAAVFGLALALLTALVAELELRATRDEERIIDPARAIHAYAFDLPDDSILRGSYSFPVASGSIYVVDCADYARLRDGDAPRATVRSQIGTREGILLTGPSDVPERGRAQWPPSTSSGFRARDPDCTSTYVAFLWDPALGDENDPQVDLRFEDLGARARTAALGLGILAVSGGVAAFVILRTRPFHASLSPIADGVSTAEILLDVTQQAGKWIERTRRYLIAAGVTGIVIWYPILLPWAWNAGRAGSTHPWSPWVFAFGVALFLGSLSGLWLREVRGIDRELVSWRARISQLRERETAFLSEKLP